MRDVPYSAARPRAKGHEIALPAFQQKLLEMSKPDVHVRPAITDVQGSRVGCRFDKVEDDAKNSGQQFVHVGFFGQFSSPVVCRISTVAEAGGASSASGGGLAR